MVDDGEGGFAEDGVIILHAVLVQSFRFFLQNFLYFTLLWFHKHAMMKIYLT